MNAKNLSSRFKADKFSDNIQGIIYIIISFFWISVLVSLVRYTSFEYHAFEIVLFRNIFALIFLLPFIYFDNQGFKSLKHNRFKLHLIRAIVGVFAMNSWFYALTKMPITEATALSFTAPLFGVIAAIIFLKEQVRFHRTIAVIIGFFGALIIIRPGFGEISIYALIVLFSTFLWSIAAILIKKMTKTETHLSMIFYLNILMIPASIPLAIFVWEPVTLKALGLFALMGITSNLAHFFLSSAYAKTDMTLLLPFEFSRLVFTGIIAYFAFHEVMDFYTLIGSIVILSSAVYVVKREKRMKILNKKVIKEEMLL